MHLDLTPSILARFWAKVDKRGPIPPRRPDLDSCWIWTASLTTAGYGRFGYRVGKVVEAHQVSWIDAHGQVSAGCELDHVCQVRRCVRPDHLEPVSHRTNLLRASTSVTAQHAAKTHCPRGHAYERTDNRGGRYCLTCPRDRARAYRARLRAQST